MSRESARRGKAAMLDRSAVAMLGIVAIAGSFSIYLGLSSSGDTVLSPAQDVLVASSQEDEAAPPSPQKVGTDPGDGRADPGGNPHDAAALAERLEASAGEGNTNAMTRLGVMYKLGIGILQNYELAASWIHRSAELGNADGMLELGRLYRDGVGVEADPVLAYVWFNRAAAAMNMRAVQEREQLLRGLTPEQLRDAQELSAIDSTELMADSSAPAELKVTARP